MDKKIVHIFECSPGDITAEDIYDDHGLLIKGKNCEIKDHEIQKMHDLKIRSISIYQLPEISRRRKNKNVINDFKKDYRNSIIPIKNILKELAQGNSPDFGKIDTVTDYIYEKIKNNNQIIECMNTVKDMDDYTYTHSLNVSLYAMLLAKWMEMSPEQVKEVIYAGVLHDIGKCKISDKIIKKEGKLTNEEFEEVKKHPVFGYEISKDIENINYEIRRAILMHHEREDGKGYPFGKMGNDLHIYTKIITIADVYDALTSKRAYKERITPFDTFKEIEAMGYACFDTEILLKFLANISQYYIGAMVKMNTEEIGVVVYMNSLKLATPVVLIGDKYVDLSKDKEYKILEVVS